MSVMTKSSGQKREGFGGVHCLQNVIAGFSQNVGGGEPHEDVVLHQQDYGFV
jgi:hypothetical protein